MLQAPRAPLSDEADEQKANMNRQFKDHLRQRWASLTTPYDNPDLSARQKRNAQISMKMSLLLIGLTFIYALLDRILDRLSEHRLPGAHLIELIAVLAVLGSAYGLSRYGRHRAALHSGVYAASLISVFSAFGRGDENSLRFLVIPIFLGVTFLSVRAVLLLVLFQSILVLTALTLHNTLNLNQIWNDVFFMWLIATVGLIFAYYRNHLESERRAEILLREAYYRSIFDSTVNAITIHDGNQVLLANDASARICGYQYADELIGKTFTDFIHPEDLNMVLTYAKERLLGEQAPPIRYKFRVLGADGKVRWAESHSQVIELGQRRVTLATSIDLTERQQFEDDLRQRMALDTLVATISNRFVNLTSQTTESGIRQALALLGEFLKVDRTYVFLAQEENGKPRFHYSYEWCAEGIRSQSEGHYFVDSEVHPWIITQITNHLSVIVADVTELPNNVPEREALIAEGILAFAEVPIIAQGVLIGSLGVDYPAPRIWTSEILSLLRLVSEIFAGVLERQKSARLLEERNQSLETLNALARITTTELEVRPLLEKVTHLVNDAFNGTSTYITSWDEQSRENTVIAEYISPQANPQEAISDLGMSYKFNYPLQAPQDFYLENPEIKNIFYADSDHLKPELREHLETYGAQSVVWMPLITEGRIMGTLDVWDSRNKRLFNRAEVALLHSIANQVAIAFNRAKLYAALQESEARNRAILDTLPDLLMWHDGDGRCLAVKSNPINQELQIQNPADMVGKGLDQLLPPQDAERALRYIREVLATRESRLYEYTSSRDGQDRFYEARLVWIDTNMVLAFIRDVTERKQAEARRLELVFERERVKILEDFISNASHDLKTPITNLKSRAYLLRRADTEAKRQRQLEVIELEIERLEQLIEDLLTMSQLDSDLVEQTRELIQLASLLNELISTSQPTASQKNVSLHFEAQPHLPVIIGSALEINRLFSNLISNAINYTPQGSVKVRAYKQDAGIMVEVEDSGIGIEKDELPYIFDRFYRADKARSTSKGGTGLGLAIAKRIVDLHSGKITVSSEPDAGTTFQVWLPCKPHLIQEKP